MVKVLLEAGASADGKADDMAFLGHAIQAGNTDVVKTLLKHGADVNGALDERGYNALCLAVEGEGYSAGLRKQLRLMCFLQAKMWTPS